jgi:hypothetical protein
MSYKHDEAQKRLLKHLHFVNVNHPHVSRPRKLSVLLCPLHKSHDHAVLPSPAIILFTEMLV